MTKNNPNSFAVDMTQLSKNDVTARFYKEQLIANAKLAGLAVAEFPFVRSGIDQAGAGNALTIGTSDKFDMDWVRRPQFLCERGIKPIYDIVDDWNEINAALVKYADEKYGLRTKDGAKITIHKDFVKVGYHVIPNDTLAEIIVRTIM